jgi:hypothetical protein
MPDLLDDQQVLSASHAYNLSAQAGSDIVKQYAERDLIPRSIHSGFLTSAAKRVAPPFSRCWTSPGRSVETLFVSPYGVRKAFYCY